MERNLIETSCHWYPVFSNMLYYDTFLQWMMDSYDITVFRYVNRQTEKVRHQLCMKSPICTVTYYLKHPQVKKAVFTKIPSLHALSVYGKVNKAKMTTAFVTLPLSIQRITSTKNTKWLEMGSPRQITIFCRVFSFFLLAVVRSKTGPLPSAGASSRTRQNLQSS